MRILLEIIKWYLLTRYKNYYFNSREKLINWQNKKAQAIARFAIKNSTFYKEFYAGFSLTDWKKLPLLDKNILMQNFSALNTAGIDFNIADEIAIKAEKSRNFSPTLGKYTVGLSSGTSGNRGLFLVSENERLAWAGVILAKMLPQTLFSKQHIAFFLRANSNIYTTLNSRFIQFDFYDLLDSVELQITKLNQFQPSILVAPPSMLRILAVAQSTNKLAIKPIRIISVAEVLEPIDKVYIEKQFKQTVHQIYQATEGFLAVTCKQGTLHLNEDILLVEKEYIDAEKRKFIPVITDFYRTTQPIIRYRLNDVLTERKEACACGSLYTALEQVDGRCDDLFFMKTIKDGKLEPIFPDFIRRALVTSSPNILEYTVIQKNPSVLEINLRCNNSTSDKIKSEIKNNLTTLCQQLNVICPELHFGEFSLPEKGRKLRRIIRKFNIDEGSIYD
ncbi:MAG: adenylate cyclase [Gammaproteobacteria bacterium]|nr:adenylate cyclase [Gammaproteobacteria bacterium]